MICRICQRQETPENGEVCINCGADALLEATAPSSNGHRDDPSPRKAERANDRQVGGDHYKTGGEEHWDRVARLGLDYFQGQITKYVERWKKKGGLNDLRKAAHFLQKYIEVEEARAAFADHDSMGTMEGSGDEAGGPDRGTESLVQDGAG